jgi:hypothetical protein
VWAVSGIWFADGIPRRQPINLTRPGVWRVVLPQPMDTVLLLKLSFVVPRAEWKGPLPERIAARARPPFAWTASRSSTG